MNFNMTTSIKTIDVSAKEWFDKSAGNSYFSGQVITLRRNMQENCKKRDVEQFGKAKNV